MTVDQSKIAAALYEATENSALDELAAEVHPGIINEFCDAVAYILDINHRMISVIGSEENG